MTVEQSAQLTDEQVEQLADRTIKRVLLKPREFPKPAGLDSYDPRPTDVVVTTFPKSGTTLTQQLTYQVVVATGGAPADDPEGLNFSDICEAAPYVDYGPDHGFHARDSSPRVFKSHSPPSMFKTSIQKHVVVFRNIASYPASCLDFLYDALAGEPVSDNRVKEAAFHKFINVRLLGNPLGGKGGGGFGFPYEKDVTVEQDDSKLPVGPWFLHAKAWVNALRPGVLVLFYEDIVKDMAGAAKKVAKFIGKDIDQAGIDHVLKRCDRDYMANDEKFMCKLEAECLGFYNTWKAKPATRDGFKQFKIKDEDLDGVNKRFQQEFGVDDYQGFMDMVKQKAAQFEGMSQ